MNDWLLLAGVCLMGAMVPGANTAVVIRAALGGNRRRAMITVAGLTTALALHVLFSLLGLTALISQTPALYEPIRWLGSAYLLYMGVTYLLARRSDSEAPEQAPRSMKSPFITGLMVSLFNPKLMLMFIALFSQVLDTAHGWPTKLLYGITPIATEAGWLTLLVLLLSRPALQTGLQRIRHTLERLIGGGLILLGIKVGLG